MGRFFQKFCQRFFLEFLWKYLLKFFPEFFLLDFFRIFSRHLSWYSVLNSFRKFFRIPNSIFPRFEHFFPGFVLENLPQFRLIFFSGIFTGIMVNFSRNFPNIAPVGSNRIHPEISTTVSLRIYRRYCCGISVRVSLGIPLEGVIPKISTKGPPTF